MRRTMESVAAERLNKIGIRDHNITNGSASENENTSAGKYYFDFTKKILISAIFHFTFFLVSPEAEEVSALVSALAHQQSRAESEAENAVAGGSDDEDFIGMKHTFLNKTANNLFMSQLARKFQKV